MKLFLASPVRRRAGDEELEGANQYLNQFARAEFVMRIHPILSQGERAQGLSRQIIATVTEGAAFRRFGMPGKVATYFAMSSYTM